MWKNWCFWTVVLEKTPESPLDNKDIKPINPKENQIHWKEYSLEGMMRKLKLQYFSHLMWRADSCEKTLILGKIEGKRRRGATEDEMVGWHHWLNGHEYEQALRDGEGRGAWHAAAHRVTKSWTRLTDWTTTSFFKTQGFCENLVTPLYIFADLYNVWLNERQMILISASAFSIL